MKLSTLLSPWISNEESFNCPYEITDLLNDSRHVMPQTAFLAYKGGQTDGRLYIDEALKRGALAIIYDSNAMPPGINLPPNAIPVANLSQLLPDIAHRFYDIKGKTAPLMVGITGTNGKTTIAYQLAQAYEALGFVSRYIGTLGEGAIHHLHPLPNTTPDALCLHRLLHRYIQEGVERVSLEVSSHALSERRVAYIPFQQAIFTNLTQDHLDYHKTMDAYAEAKALLFRDKNLISAIINKDSPYGAYMATAVHASTQLVTYGMHDKTCDVRVIQTDGDLQGTLLTIDSLWGRHTMTIQGVGLFNVYNALAVFTSLVLQTQSVDKVLDIMPTLAPSPGRMELIAKKPYVFVDYAHTPDALENVLLTVSNIKKRNRMIVVFGCGGCRDVGKRPLMGQIALRYADHVIVTSDNPRTEDPEKIIQDITKDFPSNGKWETITQREEAIKKAIAMASRDDMILIAGKGHESYQQIGQTFYPFSDKAVALACLQGELQ